MRKSDRLLESLVAPMNRKKWWHAELREIAAYCIRGKFFPLTLGRCFVVAEREN